MAKATEWNKNIDPTWPTDAEHPVNELLADRQGSLSPFGDITFPVEKTPYVHPETEINWAD